VTSTRYLLGVDIGGSKIAVLPPKKGSEPSFGCSTSRSRTFLAGARA